MFTQNVFWIFQVNSLYWELQFKSLWTNLILLNLTVLIIMCFSDISSISLSVKIYTSFNPRRLCKQSAGRGVPCSGLWKHRASGRLITLYTQMHKLLPEVNKQKFTHHQEPVRVAQGVEAWPASTRFVQRSAGSNSASGMDVCVRLCVCNLKRKTNNKKKKQKNFQHSNVRTKKFIKKFKKATRRGSGRGRVCSLL